MATFTSAPAVSASLFVKAGFKFRLTVTGTWVATLRTEESNNGGTSWKQLDEFTANQALDYDAVAYDRNIRISSFAYTSGTATYTTAVVGAVGARQKYLSVPVGAVAHGSIGTDTTPSATVGYLVEIFIPVPFVATGAACLNGSAAATDKYIFALYDTSGKLLGNTTTAGVTCTGTDAWQQIAFGAPIALQPGRYILMVQTNGTTTRLRTIATLTNPDVLAGSITTVFATIPATIAFPETFTADKGVVMYLYT